MTAAVARRDAAKAAVDRLEAEAAKYRILAPIDGVVISRHADPGETVTPGRAAGHDRRPDPAAGRGRSRRVRHRPHHARCHSDRSPPRDIRGRRWRGQVEEIADAVVARQTRPEDPGRPADTRVLRVKVAFLEKTPLKLGQHVEVEIARPEAR